MAITRNDIVTMCRDARTLVTDEFALQTMDMFPYWRTGLTITQDDITNGKHRSQYNGKLYKCVQAHTTQADWTPDVTPALWAVIDVTHAGTIEDPIPASRGMEYVKGLYYIENNVIYLMNRQGMQDGESVVLQYMPSELVGQYFEIVG